MNRQTRILKKMMRSNSLEDIEKMMPEVINEEKLNEALEETVKKDNG